MNEILILFVSNWTFPKHFHCDALQYIKHASHTIPKDYNKQAYLLTTSCDHKWEQYTPALITTHVIQKYPIKILFCSCVLHRWGFFRNYLFQKNFGIILLTRVSWYLRFCSSLCKKFGKCKKIATWQQNLHQNTKRYSPEKKDKVPETPFSAKYLATRGLKMRLGTQNCIQVKRLTP